MENILTDVKWLLQRIKDKLSGGCYLFVIVSKLSTDMY